MVRLPTNLRAVAQVLSLEKMLYSPAVAPGYTWKADSQAFKHDALQDKMAADRNDTHGMNTSIVFINIYMTVVSASLCTKVKRNLHKCHIPLTY